MSHHSYDPMDDARGAILRKLFKAQAEAHASPETAFPDGKLTPADEGLLAFSVGIESGKVVIHFAEPTAWMGMTPDQAAEFGNLLIQKARAIGLTKPLTISLQTPKEQQ